MFPKKFSCEPNLVKFFFANLGIDKQSIIRLFTNKFLINENLEQRGDEDELIGRLREKWRTSYKMNLKMSVSLSVSPV